MVWQPLVAEWPVTWLLQMMDLVALLVALMVGPAPWSQLSLETDGDRWLKGPLGTSSRNRGWLKRPLGPSSGDRQLKQAPRTL